MWYIIKTYFALTLLIYCMMMRYKDYFPPLPSPSPQKWTHISRGHHPYKKRHVQLDFQILKIKNVGYVWFSIELYVIFSLFLEKRIINSRIDLEIELKLDLTMSVYIACSSWHFHPNRRINPDFSERNKCPGSSLCYVNVKTNQMTCYIEVLLLRCNISWYAWVIQVT